jgi:hypothetical protein
MQDELTKHGLKIYKTMADRKHTFGEKLREILIEIFIIVFAVTLSIWLHSWSENRHEQKEVKEFLRGLKIDLTDDIRVIRHSWMNIAEVDSNFSIAYMLEKGQKPDSIVHHYFRYSEMITHINNARYEGFKSSGKMGNIGNDSLRENILVYYQQTIPNLARNEEFANMLQQKLLDFEIEKSNISINDWLANPKTKSFLQLSTNNLGNSLDSYDLATRQAKHLITQIDKEIAR